MSTLKKRIVAAVGIATLSPLPAFAHPMRGVGDFYAGMLHPVVTMETVLPMVALSLLAGQQRRKTAIHLLAAFPAALIVGALLASLRDAPSSLGVVQLILTAGFGILVACAPRAELASGCTGGRARHLCGVGERRRTRWTGISISIHSGSRSGWAASARVRERLGTQPEMGVDSDRSSSGRQLDRSREHPRFRS